MLDSKTVLLFLHPRNQTPDKLSINCIFNFFSSQKEICALYLIMKNRYIPNLIAFEKQPPHMYPTWRDLKIKLNNKQTTQPKQLILIVFVAPVSKDNKQIRLDFTANIYWQKDPHEGGLNKFQNKQHNTRVQIIMQAKGDNISM